MDKPTRYKPNSDTFMLPGSDNIMRRVYADSFDEAVEKMIAYEKEKGYYRAKAWDWIKSDWNPEDEEEEA